VSKETVKAYKEQALFEMIQDAVDDLHRIADRLEKYANAQIEGEHNIQGDTDA
jgi:hypothetical protein